MEILTEKNKKILENSWNDNDKFQKPEILFCKHNDKWYLTISDDKTIFHFMSLKGKAFVATKSNCKIKTKNNIDYYNIKEFHHLQIITCSNLRLDIENFVEENIKKLNLKEN